jgi:hypothetical protein
MLQLLLHGLELGLGCFQGLSSFLQALSDGGRAFGKEISQGLPQEEPEGSHEQREVNKLVK